MAILTSLANYKYSLNTLVIDKTNTLAFSTVMAILKNNCLHNPCLFYGSDEGRKLLLSLLKDLEIKLGKKTIYILVDGFFQSNFSKNSFQNYDILLFSNLENIIYKNHQQDFIQLVDNLCNAGRTVLMLHSGELKDIKFMQDAMLHDYTNGITVEVL